MRSCSRAALPMRSSRSAGGTAPHCGPFCATARATARSSADLLAETLAAAWTRRRRFTDERDGSAGPWLFAIARNQASLHARRGTLGPPRPRADRHAGTAKVAARLAYDEAEERLDSELLAPVSAEPLADMSANRPQRTRAARRGRSAPTTRSATRLAITPAAARTRVYRALSALRASLKGS